LIHDGIQHTIFCAAITETANFMNKTEIQAGSRHRSIILIILILTALGTYGYIQWQKSSNGAQRQELPSSGRPAPDFELPSLTGKAVRLTDFRGKVVFLNIWATWCGPCREEMPSMEKLYQALKDDNFEILAVSIDSKGADVVAPFAQKYNLTFPILLDQKGSTGSLYGTTGVPETFIIDQRGVIVSKVIGYRNWADPGVIRSLKGLARKTSDGI
jgi:peroxiredoxin